MPVPKASMNEDGNFLGREDNIRMTNDAFVMKAIAQAALMQRRANEQFRFGIFTPDKRHACGAFAGGQCIQLMRTPKY